MTQDPREHEPSLGAEAAADGNTISPLPGEPGIPNVAARQRVSMSKKGLLAVALLIGSMVAVAAYTVQRASASGKKADEAESKLVKDKPTAATSEPRRLEMPPAPTASAPSRVPPVQSEGPESNVSVPAPPSEPADMFRVFEVAASPKPAKER